MEQMIVRNRAGGGIYECLLLLFLILWSGGGFTYGLFPMWMIVALPVVGALFLFRHLRLCLGEIFLIAMIALVMLLQMIKFHGTLITVIRPISTVIVCAMSARILGKRFPSLFVSIMYWISLTALSFWLISQIPSGLSFLRAIASNCPLLGWDNFEDNTNVVDTLYVFSIPREIDGVMRNSGPFWEPGRFTIFITLALAVNLFHNRKPLFEKRNAVFIFTNITTFSTTGYIAMGVLFVSYICFSKIRLSYKIILTVVLSITAVYVSGLDFMSEKLVAQSSDNETWSRFGAMAYHWSQIVESPVIGYGPYLEKAFTRGLFSSPNGLTDLLRYFGIPLSIYLYVLLYKGTRLYCGNGSSWIKVSVFIVILLLSFSQTITYSPFFYLLYFFAFNTSSEQCSIK